MVLATATMEDTRAKRSFPVVQHEVNPPVAGVTVDNADDLDRTLVALVLVVNRELAKPPEGLTPC